MWRIRAKPVAADEESIACGTKLFCQIDREGNHQTGALRDQQGNIRWQFRVRNKPVRRVSGNPFNKPDFVVGKPDEKYEVIIRRASFVPPLFEVIEAGNVIGKIKLQSILRNKYLISVDGVGCWMFRMPLFTIHFHGDSSAGTEIWVVVGPSKTEWSILIKPGVKERPLVAALAFIHNEWWNYG